MKWMLLAIALFFGAPARAQEAPEPNYTTQRLLILNERDEVLLQRNAFGWSTPGVRFDKRNSIRVELDRLARKYGLTINHVSLAGLFTYEYGYTNAISTRSHYWARQAGGALAKPEDMLEVGWFPRGRAIEMIALDNQKAPPSFVEKTTQMLRSPETIWGGAFYVWQEGEIYKSRMTEPFHALGRTMKLPR